MEGLVSGGGGSLAGVPVEQGDSGCSTKLEIKHRSARSAVTGMYLGPVQILPGRTAVTGMYLGPVQILPGRTAPGSEGVGVVYDRRLLPAADCQERCVPGQS